MKNRKVKQMMCDLERQNCIDNGYPSGPKHGFWIDWFDGGVCSISCNGNFLWVNKHTVSIKANELKG